MLETPVKHIAKPLKFRLEAMNVIDDEHDSTNTDKQE